VAAKQPLLDTGGNRWHTRPTLSTTTKSKFGQVVTAKLLSNKLAGRKPDSIRGLARVMANGDPARAETFKRSLMKWMAPSGLLSSAKPSPYSRTLVAHHLEIDASELSDEEDRGMTLDEFLQSRIEIAVEKRFAERSKASA